MQQHITVLTEAAVHALHLAPDAVIVDATLGSGGHAHSIYKKLGKDGTLVLLDVDQAAIDACTIEERIDGPAVHMKVGNFKDLDEILATMGIAQVNGILADLGWRIEQFEESNKGFSFKRDEPLIMTLGDPSAYPFTAEDIVNDWEEDVIRNILKGYGEERYAKRIAAEIVSYRAKARITTSRELATIIASAVPEVYRKGSIHPATRSFQALRIAVNDELGALQTFIEKSVSVLANEGRLAIISFHSLEDRIVKHTFRDLAKDGVGTVETKKPIVASEEERSKNPRARSAKLRIFRKHESS